MTFTNQACTQRLHHDNHAIIQRVKLHVMNNKVKYPTNIDLLFPGFHFSLEGLHIGDESHCI